MNKPVQAGGSLPSLALAQQQLIKMPYAAFLGVSLRVGPDGLETSTRSRADLIGNTNLPALHGGVIGSLLDITGMLTLVFLKALDQSPRLIDMDIDYLRSGRAQSNHGRAESNGIFMDQGSSGILVQGNVIAGTKCSPMRFHLAGQNTLKENQCFHPVGVEPLKFNNTPEVNIKTIDNLFQIEAPSEALPGSGR